MACGLQETANRLQSARQAKGLSQRDLSKLAGVPQAQISRIEAGAVDLRLSSLVALANALDLELALVPRKAVPAVRSLSRDALERNRKGSIAAQREMQRISDTLRNLQIAQPKLEELAQLQKSFAELQRFMPPVLELKDLRQLRRSMEQISRHPKRQISAMAESLNLMQMIRDKAAQAPMPGIIDGASRPVYSLDQEDGDV